MENLPIEGALPPPRLNRRWYPVRPAKGWSPLKVVFLCDGFIGLWTHFIDGASWPCVGDGPCHVCPAESPRYEGFAGVWSLTHGETTVARLTAQTCEDLVAVLREHGTLRGLQATIQRMKGMPQGVVRATVTGRIGDVARLGPPFNVWASVNRLFGKTPAWRPALLPACASPFRADNGGAEVTAPSQFGGNAGRAGA